MLLKTEIRCLFLVFITIVFYIFPSKPGFADNRKWTVEDSMKVKEIGNFSISPDGKRIVYSSLEPVIAGKGSKFEVIVYLADTDGKKNFRILTSSCILDGFTWSPDGKTIAYIKHRPESSEICLLHADEKNSYKIAEFESFINNLDWSPDGKKLAFIMTDPLTDKEKKDIEEENDAQVMDENLKMNHIWLVSSKMNPAFSPEKRQLTKGNFSVFTFDWSPDGKSIVFSHAKSPSAKETKLSVVNVESGSIKTIADTGGWESNPIYSHDGRWIAFLRCDLNESYFFVKDAYVLPSEGGNPRALARSFDRYIFFFLQWSKDDKFLYFNENKGPVNRIYALPFDGGKPYEIRGLNKPDMTFSSTNMNSSGSKVGFVLSGTKQPEELYVSDINRFNPVRISNINDNLPVNRIAKTELISWNSSDGMKIEGLLTYPLDYKKGQKYPLILFIHGGPSEIFTYSFIGNPGLDPVAAFASEGFAVLRCNIRGSSGYGSEFRKANRRDWGGADYIDLMSGVDHVIKLGIASPLQLGVMGWSYGGFLTSWIISHTDRFKAASIGAGIVNLISFTGTTDTPDFAPQYLERHYWDEYDFYIAHSPIGYVKNIKTPTLILHGTEDLRVPISQGKELYTALKMRGVPVKMVSYPRTGHGITEPKLIIDCAKRNIDWFKHYLMEN